MSVQQLIRELKKDATTYRHSGGGITLSGGEPLVQSDFASQLLKGCKAQGWNTAMETTGVGSREAIDQVIPYVDTVLLDIKHMNRDKHKEYTGVTNDLVLKNAREIAKISKTVVRVPVIPGFNYSVEEIKDIADFAKTLTGVQTVHLLPYHSFGENKYGLMGREYTLKELKNMSPKDLEECKKAVEDCGLQCIIGG